MRAATRRDDNQGQSMWTEGQAMRYGWAAFGLIGALSLTHCTLDRRPIISPHYIWRCEATVRSSDGIVGTLSSEDGIFTNGRPFETGFGGDWDAAAADERVRTKWRLFIRERLDDPALPESVRLRLGAPPYCLLTDNVTRTETAFTEASPADPTGPEIAMCGTIPPPTSCGNDPGVFPTLAVNPPMLVFPDVPLGSPAVDMIVTYENIGAGRLCLGTPMIDRTVSSHPDDFVVIVASDCEPSTPDERMWGSAVLSEATGRSCQVTVRFNPLNPGARAAELRATTNDPATPASRVPLTGTGIGGVLALSEANLCFNVTAAIYPTISATVPQHRRIVTLSNGGPGAVSVTSVSAGGMGWARRLIDASGVAREPRFTLASGESIEVRIFEAEGTVGSSTLIVASDASTEPLMLPLQGFDTGCTP